jgi:hypothetical protein
MEIVVEGGRGVLSMFGAPRATHDANDVHLLQKFTSYECTPVPTLSMLEIKKKEFLPFSVGSSLGC